MRQLAQADGHDEPRLVGELVLGWAAVVQDVVVGAEQPASHPY
jgi:hypothetical protein